jgi:UDPglucose 6-dehydrogenase
MNEQLISVCGLGVVGSALYNVFKKRNVNVIGYDKYKKGGIGDIKDMLKTEIVFLCLPTPYCKVLKKYNKESINNICTFLSKNKYNGIVVLKSTVEPGTTRKLKEKYNLNFLHNPEFLSANTAEKDFEEQKHIVIGSEKLNNKISEKLLRFYKKYWKNSKYSKGVWEETELMKISVNSFYSVKIQFFNEIYLCAKKMNIDYNTVLNMMLNNKWITKNHTKVPGTDGKLSYGGMCFPKDTNAFYNYLLRENLPCSVLGATIEERNNMRDD